MEDGMTAEAGELDSSAIVDEGMEGAEEQGYSSLEDASDEDLSAYLSELRETAAKGLPVDNIIENHQRKASGLVDDSQDVSGQQKPEQEVNQQKEQFITKEQHEQMMQDLAARLSMEQQRNVQKETEIQKRRGHISQLKQEVKALQDRLQDGLEDLALINPLEAMERKQQMKENDVTLKDLDNEEQAIQFEDTSKEMFNRLAPKYIEYSVDDMVQVLEQDGVKDPRALQAFKANPFRFTYPEALVQIAHRAAERKVATQLLNINKALLGKLQKYEGGAKPQSVVDSIQKAAKGIPSMNASRGGAAESDTVSDFADSEISTMSNAELQALMGKFYKGKR